MSFARLANMRLEYKWLVTVSVTLGMFMSILDSTIVNVAIPTMRAAFGRTSSTSSGS